MPGIDSRVTIHMAASLDGFIARRDGRVDWLETSDEFPDGDSMDAGLVAAFLATIDCYVMGSRTYETALRFESQGFGWSYGEKPTFVLTSRDLPRTRDTVRFHSGDLAHFVNERLRPEYRTIWFVGGGMVAAECLSRGLADELRYSILPILIGDGFRSSKSSTGRSPFISPRSKHTRMGCSIFATRCGRIVASRVLHVNDTGRQRFPLLPTVMRTATR